MYVVIDILYCTCRTLNRSSPAAAVTIDPALPPTQPNAKHIHSGKLRWHQLKWPPNAESSTQAYSPHSGSTQPVWWWRDGTKDTQHSDISNGATSRAFTPSSEWNEQMILKQFLWGNVFCKITCSRLKVILMSVCRKLCDYAHVI